MSIQNNLLYAHELWDVARALLQTSDQNAALHEAHFRRSISTAYYSAFHYITQVGSALLLDHEQSSLFASRAFKHKQISSFLSQQLMSQRIKDPKNKYLHHFSADVLPEIAGLAQLFINLQQRRHEADYDFQATIRYSDAMLSLDQADTFLKNYRQLLTHHPDELKTLTGILLFRDISVVL